MIVSRETMAEYTMDHCGLPIKGKIVILKKKSAVYIKKHYIPLRFEI